jgi:hypothetical protein
MLQQRIRREERAADIQFTTTALGKHESLAEGRCHFGCEIKNVGTKPRIRCKAPVAVTLPPSFVL